MRTWFSTFLLFLGAFVLFGMKSSPEMEIFPSELDRETQVVGGPHILRTPETSLLEETLLITFGGTQSRPQDFRAFAELAQSKGYFVLSLDYFNRQITTVCRRHPDPECFDRFRAENNSGEDVSPHIDVNKENSIMYRLRQVLAEARRRDPRWGIFWKDQDIDWSKVVVAGHSQGSGHAAYLSKKYSLKGVILFAGPQDSHEGDIASWVKQPGATESRRYRALLHLNDFFGGLEQAAVVEELKRAGQNPEDLSGSIIILSDRETRDPHNAVIGTQFIQEWESLLAPSFNSSSQIENLRP